MDGDADFLVSGEDGFGGFVAIDTATGAAAILGIIKSPSSAEKLAGAS